MAQRALTAIIGLPILIILINLGGLWLRAGLLVLSLIGLFEFYRAMSGKVMVIHFVGYGFAVLYYLLVVGSRNHAFLLITAAGFILVTQSLMVVFYKKVTFNDCLITISGFFYVAFLLSFIYFVRDRSLYFVWLIFISAYASDTFAYLVGRNFGRHKLTGSPSPGKTVEGCIGGVLGAAFIGYLYGIFFIYHQPMMINVVAVSVMGAIFGQMGDLFASAIKRSAGIKDFGNLLPGHGGVLDRFDSTVTTAPVVYMVMIWVGYLI